MVVGLATYHVYVPIMTQSRARPNRRYAANVPSAPAAEAAVPLRSAYSEQAGASANRAAALPAAARKVAACTSR